MGISRRVIMKQTIFEQRDQGLTKTEIINYFRQRGEKPPSWPTLIKYYNQQEEESIEEVSPFAKVMVFDQEPFKSKIVEILQQNCAKKNLKCSSVYDVLCELFIDTGKYEKLPGNEQTLRNYIRFLKSSGQVDSSEEKRRIYQVVGEMPPGKQMLLDFGQQKIGHGIVIHFLCILLRYSGFLYVFAQDHRFIAPEACRAIYLFFQRIGGRTEEGVIDQDCVFICQENNGEIIETETFRAFLKEQEISLFVCRKADPETKGSVEKAVQFVKQNFFSARNLTSLAETRTGLNSWLKRKNERIHRTTLKVPIDELMVEQKALRPLLPSLYANVTTDYILFDIRNSYYLRYHTNRYSVPYTYCFKTVKFRIIEEQLFVYDIETDQEITRWALSPGKNGTFTNPDHKCPDSGKARAIANALIRQYGTLMAQFLERVFENYPRYKKEQAGRIELYLSQLEKVSPSILEEALSSCIASGNFKASAFTLEYATLEKFKKEQTESLFPELVTEPASGIPVQKRSLSAYADRFNAKASSYACTLGETKP
jgi:hypothetical protein